MHVPTNKPLIVSTVGMLAAAIFFIDTFMPLGVAGCVPYVLVVLLSLLLHHAYAPLLTAIACTVLTYGSMAFLPAGSEWGLMFLNRSLAVFAIWATALLGSRLKQQSRTLGMSETRIQSDITERKQVEQRQELQQGVLNKIVGGKHSQSNVLNDLCLQVEQLIPSAICSIMVLDESTGTLKVGAVPSGGETACTILDGLVPGEFGGACGTAVHTRTTVIIEDTETDPRWEPIREAARPLGIKSCWSIPIFGQDQRVMGSFAISHTQVRRPTPSDLQLLETASSLACIILQRTQDMDSLSESANRYRDLYESAPLAYFTSSMDGRIKSANTSAVELLGYSQDELKGRSVVDLYAATKDGREKAQQIHILTQAGQDIEAEELEMQRADGTHVWVSLTVRLIRDANGTLIERRALVQDITARKKADERLLLTKFVMDHAGDAILMAGPDKRILYANEAATDSLGYESGQLIGKSIADISPTHEPKTFTQKLEYLQRGQTLQYESRHRTKQGEEFPIELTLSLLEHKGNNYTCAIVRDITDRKRGEELLANQKTILEMISTKYPLPEILKHICLMVENHADHMHCSVLLLEGKVLRNGAAPTLPETYSRKLDGIAIGPCVGSCGTAAYRKEPVIVSDIATDPLWEKGRRLALSHGLQACWSTPILSSAGSVLGTFAMYYGEPQTPDSEDLKLIAIATSLASIAIEQHRDEEALQKSEERYRSLYEDNPTMYFTVSLEGTVLSVNQFGASQLGYTVQELLSKPVSMLFLEDDQVAVGQKLAECLENPNSLAHWEFQKIRKDGRIIWVSETVRVVMDKDNHSVFLIVCEDITQRKYAEEKQKEISMALSNAMPGIAQISPEGNYTEVNDSYAAMLGCDCHELIGASWEPTVHSEDLPSAHAAYQEMVKTGKGEFEAKALRKDGSTFYEHVLLIKQVNKNQELIGHHRFMRDISERRFSEEALRESEERFQSILDNSSAVIYVKNLQGQYVLINREFERIFNLDRENVKGKTDFDLFTHEIAKAFTENDKKVLEHGDPLEWEEVAPHTDGLHTYISNKFLLRRANGTPYALCGISTDITQRKQAEMNTKLHNHILESSPNGILITDGQKPDNPITYCNAAFEKMTGYTQDEILGRNCRFLQKDDIDQDGLTTLQAALSNGQECQTVLRNYKKDGTLFWVDFRLAPVFSENGDLRHYIGVLTDITQRKIIEDSLRMIAEATSTLTGLEFFYFLVKNLATCLNVQYAVMTDASNISERTIRTLAVWNGTTFAENFDIPLADSPCERVLKGETCDYRHSIQQHFPHTQILKTLNVESYVGFPLFATSGEILGHLTAMDTKPIPNNSPAEAIIKLFATRAAAELERNRAEVQLREAYNQTRELSIRLEAAEEAERKRIARELHDEFGQMLTGLKFDLSWVQRRLSEQPSLTPYNIILLKTRSMANLTDDLIHMVRRIATSLRPSILDDLGLIPALEWHTKDFQERTGITCTFSSKLHGHEPVFEGEQATALFRITQELFTNVLRHAEASRVKLVLQKDKEFLTLSVRDNGRGLVDRQTSQLPSLGLLGIQERVASFGGDFLIQGRPGKGTQATVRIPLTEKKLA